MADFPALVPATVSITPGVVPTTLQVGYDGSSTTSTADLVPAGDALVMTFQGLSEAQARSVPDHQLSQQGRSFGFNSATLAPSETPPGFRWTYARPVAQDDIRAVPGTEFYAFTVEFVGVWIRRVSTPSASVRIQLRTRGARALPVGTPSASVRLRLTTTGAGMQTGTPSQSTLLLLKTTGAGIISTPLNDPDYASVLLHLPLTGDAGFTDVCGRSLSVSPQGGVIIEPTGGRWGDGAAFFNGASNSWLSVALAETLGISDYTIRFWFNLILADDDDGLYQFTTTPGTSVGSSSARTGEVTEGDPRVGLAMTHGGVTTSIAKSSGLGPFRNEWIFYQQTRTNGVHETKVTAVGGTTRASNVYNISINPNLTDTFLQIGAFYFGGSNPAQRVFNGRISDFQISLTALPHVVPTGPLPIF
jgi:hypothetical protein